MAILARESRGVTQKELAEQLGITQGKLSKFENGIQDLADDVMQRMATVLEYPIEFFEQQEKVIHISSEFHYRKKASVSKKDLNKMEALINVLRINVQKLLLSVDIPESNYPKLEVEKHGSASIIANFIRDYWKLPKGRIDNLTKVLEDNGILVYKMDFEGIEIDGINILTDDNVPIIIVNKDCPADRERMTIAHELGHLIMHKLTPPNDKSEGEAYEFASELLMPEKDIKPQLYRLNLTKLDDLKCYWKVSMSSIIYRAKVLKCLTEDQAKYLWMHMGRLGYKMKEPERFPSEIPSLLKEVIGAHMNDLGYSHAEMAKLLVVSENDFSSRFLETRVRLRIVK
jgi:Zn-dependent peptidase ImmA (M78 family)/DNA-binding XRE family transcriptional regulator